MIKKVGLLLFILLALGIAEVFFTNQSEESNKDVIIDDQTKSTEIQALVSLLFESAEKGQVVNIPFTVGETDIQQLYEVWGEPDNSSDHSLDTYDEYEKRNATIGHRSGTIFDLRSNASFIQNIRLEDIKSIGGDPDYVRSYQDEEVDQSILVYEVTSNFQLKWILPKPTSKEPNPYVHHISVYTDLKEVSGEVVDPLDEMTLEEKVGQMIISGIEGDSFSSEIENLITKQKVGGIIFLKKNLTNPHRSIALINAIKEQIKLEKYHLFLSVDQEGGRVTRLPGLLDQPTNLEIGRKNDEVLTFGIGALLAMQVKAFGMNMDYAPVIDVNSNPNNPVIGDRAFGDDVQIVSNLGVETMQGIQSENVVSVIKHFPGHGDTDVDSHMELPVIYKTLEDLKSLELIPFQEAIANGADVVMVAHILMPNIDNRFPSSMSEDIITGILRNQLGFEGVIVTDDMTMDAIEDNYEMGEAAVQAIKAGNDIVLIAHEYNNIQRAIEAIVQAVKDGEITVERINESVDRIIKLKEKYKLNNDLVKEIDTASLNKSIRLFKQKLK